MLSLASTLGSAPKVLAGSKAWLKKQNKTKKTLNLVEHRHLASAILIPGGPVSVLWRSELGMEEDTLLTSDGFCRSRLS